MPKRPDNLPTFASWILSSVPPPPPAPRVLGDPRRNTQEHFVISALIQAPLNYTTHTNAHFNRVTRRPKPLCYATLRSLPTVVTQAIVWSPRAVKTL